MPGSRTLLNLALLLALAALALVVVYEPGRDSAPAPAPITRLTPADIHHIQLQRPGRADLTLERVDGQWRIAGTQAYPAADFPVRSLLRLASTPALRHYPAGELDLGRIGLGEDASRVRFNQDTEIRFGATDPLDDNRYVQVGEQVSLIQNRFQHLLEGGIESWISRRLLPPDRPIEAIELPDLRLHKTGEGHWRAEPEPPGIASDALLALVEHWRQAQAAAVQRHEGDGQGDRVRIWLQGADAPLEFRLQEAGDDRLLIRPDLGLAYRLGAYRAAELLQLTPAAAPARP